MKNIIKRDSIYLLMISIIDLFQFFILFLLYLSHLDAGGGDTGSAWVAAFWLFLVYWHISYIIPSSAMFILSMKNNFYKISTIERFVFGILLWIIIQTIFYFFLIMIDSKEINKEAYIFIAVPVIARLVLFIVLEPFFILFTHLLINKK